MAVTHRNPTPLPITTAAIPPTIVTMTITERPVANSTVQGGALIGRERIRNRKRIEFAGTKEAEEAEHEEKLHDIVYGILHLIRQGMRTTKIRFLKIKFMRFRRSQGRKRSLSSKCKTRSLSKENESESDEDESGSGDEIESLSDEDKNAQEEIIEKEQQKRRCRSGTGSKNSKKKRYEKESENSYSDEGSGSIIAAEGKSQADEMRKAKVDAEALIYREMIEAQPALDNESVVGPMPLPRAEGRISYGGALDLQGKCILPRGTTRCMPFVLGKKTKYSAEGKRALAMFNYEEKAKSEHKVMADLQRLMQCHIGQDVDPTHDPFSGKTTDGADA
ncbi:hypothetical protein RCOM_0557290 [Ricinus communis]|uniref:NF-kappa-B-activating protein C-terminal domain-containing protein n=1 Tax=Ricinus communis TaxID=3988 RepID=B9S402_RICCO|nr:hypothetical protein RCOM_0557290 [Ricinus communis]